MATYRTARQPPPGLPVLNDWMKRLIWVLFGVWLMELLSNLAGAPTNLLMLPGFLGWVLMPWTIVTRYLVQGTSTSAVASVLLGLLVIYFLLPGTAMRLTRRQIAEGTLAGVVGGTLLVLFVDVVVSFSGAALQPGYDHGWRSLLMALVVLFALANPDGEILLYFVIPARTSWFLWGSLAYAGLLVLAAASSDEPILGPVDHVGVWLGTYGWWFWRGPGGRRRHLKRQAGKVERELRNLRVLPGGREQSGRDDVWHRGATGAQPLGDGIVGA